MLSPPSEADFGPGPFEQAASPASAKSRIEGKKATLFIEATETSRCRGIDEGGARALYPLNREKSVIDHRGGAGPASAEAYATRCAHPRIVEEAKHFFGFGSQ